MEHDGEEDTDMKGTKTLYFWKSRTWIEIQLS